MSNLRQHQIATELYPVDNDWKETPVLDLQQVKEHCRLPLEEDWTDEDDLLSGYLAAATEMVESHAEIALVPRTMQLSLQYMPAARGVNHRVRFEKTPVTALTDAFYYKVGSEDPVQIEDAFLRTRLKSNPPEVWVRCDAFGCTPDTDRPDCFNFKFTSGNPDSAYDPKALQAIRFLVGLMYQKREPVHLWTGKAVLEMPLTYQMLIDACRWRL